MAEWLCCLHNWSSNTVRQDRMRIQSLTSLGQNWHWITITSESSVRTRSMMSAFDIWANSTPVSLRACQMTIMASWVCCQSYQHIVKKTPLSGKIQNGLKWFSGPMTGPFDKSSRDLVDWWTNFCSLDLWLYTITAMW